MSYAVEVLLERQAELIAQRRAIDDRLQDLGRAIAAEHSHPGFTANGTGQPPKTLRHTRIRAARIDGVSIEKPSWNEIVFLLARRINSRDTFGELVTNAWVPGEHADHRFVPELNLSYHGVSAPDAWKIIGKIAKHLDLRVELEVQWLPKASRHADEVAMLYV